MSLLAGRFRLERPLGEGGLAVVWAALDTSTGRPVAIKRLKAEAAAQPGLLRRLRREARAMARLDHPHVVKVLDLAEGEAGEPLLVLERVDGPTLGVWGRGPHGLALRVACLEQILAALGHLHGRGVVHRDLNPANVVVTRGSGGAPHVKLLDFGFARLGDEPEAEARQVFGAPAYMSPEQAAGEARLGPPTDLYAVAAIGWELICGRPPFEADSATEVLMQHLTAPLPALQPLPGLSLPAGLGEWLAGGLAKAPGRRPASAGDMRRALLSLVGQGGQALGAAPPDGPPSLEESGGSLSFAVLSEAADAERMPLVGREEAQAWLWAGVREVCSAGRGICALLEGPSGVGATRLGDWLLTTVADGGWLQTGRVAWSAGPSSLGLVDALRPLLWPGEDAVAAQELLLGDWLARPVGAPIPHAAVARSLARAARRQPVLLLLDGLDLASEAEQEGVVRLAEAVCRPGCPVFLAVTVRREVEDERPPAVAEALLASRAEVALRRLEGLEREDLVLLGQQILLLHPDSARAVARAAAGRPLHAVMALAALRAEGSLVRQDGVYRLVAPARLPASLAEVAARWLASAFNRRSEGGGLQDLAERLAVAGQAVSFELALAVGRRAGWTPEALERGLDRLVRLGILEEAAGDRVVLRHPVLWQVLRRQATARTDAAALHLQAADAHRGAEGAWGGAWGGALAATVAGHYRAAGRIRSAVEALLEAGHRARRAGALSQASARFVRALRWLDQALDGAHVGLRAEALLGRAEVALARRAADEARELGHALRGLRIQAPEAWADGAWVLARAALLEGQSAEALRLIDEALGGRAPLDPRRRGRLNLTRARVALQQAQGALAEAAAQAAVEAFEAARDAAGQAEARLLLGGVAAAAGDGDRARRALQGAARLASAAGEAPLAALAWLRLGEGLRRAGDGVGALAAAERAEEAARRGGERLLQARAARARGDAARLQGDEAQARGAYAAAARAFEIAGDGFQHGVCLTQLGRLAWAAGELDSAAAALGRALTVLAPYGDPVRLALLHVYLAHVAALRGEPGAQAGHLARALAIDAQTPQGGGAWRRALEALAGTLPEGDERRAWLRARASGAQKPPRTPTPTGMA